MLSARLATWFMLAALVCGAASTGITAAARQGKSPAESSRRVDIFVAGQDGYHTYRIPSLIATTKGTLLAFAEGRRAGAADAGDIDLVLKRSRDNGVTWSAMQVIGDDGPNTVGNPCPVIDRKTGTIWLLTTRNLGIDREKDIIAGTSQGSRTVWVMSSTDDGVTWSTPREITREVKKPDWTWYATGPGIGIQMRNGRLVIPANHVEAAGVSVGAGANAGTGVNAGAGANAVPVNRSHLFYSDDHGKTWTLGASADAGTNESQVAELTDGRLLLNMRNHPPKPAENFRLIATSQDGGRTLSAAVRDPALIEPPAQASLIRLSRDSGTLLFANPASAKRERMTLRLSRDDGKTWPVARVIHEGPAAYSSLAVLRDASIGLLYERGERSPYETITFERLTRAMLEQ